jgi:hypothetical protein
MSDSEWQSARKRARHGEEDTTPTPPVDATRCRDDFEVSRLFDDALAGDFEQIDAADNDAMVDVVAGAGGNARDMQGAAASHERGLLDAALAAVDQSIHLNALAREEEAKSPAGANVDESVDSDEDSDDAFTRSVLASAAAAVAQSEKTMLCER